MGPIGIFDSGYGGLTILKEIRKQLPQYDYLYLGDNARAPYGTHSFDVIYKYTLQAVEALFERGCHLIILACNTASAKALRSIQQKNLPTIDPEKRVLGVIKPTVEAIPKLTKNHHIGILATLGTIRSLSYEIEIKKIDPLAVVSGIACPMWVPIVENGESNSPGADYFVQKKIHSLLSIDPKIDTLILGCTHYPLLIKNIKKFVPGEIKIISQGKYVAESLKDYLNRHKTTIQKNISQEGECLYLTTENTEKFKEAGALFLDRKEAINVERIIIQD